MRARRGLLIAGLALLLLGMAAPAAGARKRSPAERALAQLYRADQITAGDYRKNVLLFRHARSAARRLSGSPAANLGGVVENTDALAEEDLLVPERLGPVFLVLERNYDWFWRERGEASSYGARKRFPGSPIVWQFYPGSGWQLQPLANWGRVNGLLGGRHPQAAARLARALLALLVPREGRPAFEYYFPWGGRPPGWTSAMPQAAAMKALARLWQETGDASWAGAAHGLTGLLEILPPWGVRRNTDHGAHYLLYSQLPEQLVGNAFASTLLNLYDYVQLARDPQGQALLDAGLAEGDASFPEYDTGAWSLYYRTPDGRGRESDLHYHQYLGQLLRRLCKRLARDPYCALGTRFLEYEKEPVEVKWLRLKQGKRSLRASFWASKIGSGTIRVRLGSKVVRSASVSTRRGRVATSFEKLGRGGTFTLEVEARSLNGIESQAEREFSVRR